jgi:hypothetical protein
MSLPRSLAAVLPAVTRQALARRKSAIGSLIADWPAIVGADLADRASPLRLTFPSGRRDGATLTLRAEPGDALEIKHNEPRILERINGHYGYRAVDRLKFVHAPLSKRQPAATRQPLTEADRATIDATVARIEDGDLRERLAVLGQALFRRIGPS